MVLRPCDTKNSDRREFEGHWSIVDEVVTVDDDRVVYWQTATVIATRLLLLMASHDGSRWKREIVRRRWAATVIDWRPRRRPTCSRAGCVHATGLTAPQTANIASQHSTAAGGDSIYNDDCNLMRVVSVLTPVVQSAIGRRDMWDRSWVISVVVVSS